MSLPNPNASNLTRNQGLDAKEIGKQIGIDGAYVGMGA